MKRWLMLTSAALALASCGGDDGVAPRETAATATAQPSETRAPSEIAGEADLKRMVQALAITQAVREYCEEVGAIGDDPKLKRALAGRILNWSVQRTRLASRTDDGAKDTVRKLDAEARRASAEFERVSKIAREVNPVGNRNWRCAPDLKRQLDALRRAAA